MLFLSAIHSKVNQRSVYQSVHAYCINPTPMSHRLVNLASTVAVVLGLVVPAQAATIDFTGTLTTLSDPGNVTGYDPKDLRNAIFAGSYTFDPTTPNSFYSTSLDFYNPPSANLPPEQFPSGRYVQPVEKFAVNIGNTTIDLPSGEGTAFSRQFENSDTDSITVSTLVKGAAAREGYKVFLSLADSTGRSLSSVSSNAESTSVPQWDSSYFQLFRTGSECDQTVPADCLFAEGVLTSLSDRNASTAQRFTTRLTSDLADTPLSERRTPVPEPASIATILGLGILGAARRFKQRGLKN
ncbi:PEP-CTERM sorting domain-containing protein [Phormidesmis sp. 146-12]